MDVRIGAKLFYPNSDPATGPPRLIHKNRNGRQLQKAKHLSPKYHFPRLTKLNSNENSRQETNSHCRRNIVKQSKALSSQLKVLMEHHWLDLDYFRVKTAQRTELKTFDHGTKSLQSFFTRQKEKRIRPSNCNGNRSLRAGLSWTSHAAKSKSTAENASPWPKF